MRGAIFSLTLQEGALSTITSPGPCFVRIQYVLGHRAQTEYWYVDLFPENNSTLPPGRAA